MRRYCITILVGGLLLCACRERAANPPPATARPSSLKPDLVFVTRDGVTTTPDMAANLDDALSVLRLPLDYQVINLKNLSTTDPRIGYPTPTVLYRNRDLFDMPEPTPPYPEPS